MITSEEWNDYKDYLSDLTQEELEVELKWLESVGQAKKRGSVVSCIENYTIQ
jgi:hypothetical protein